MSYRFKFCLFQVCGLAQTHDLLHRDVDASPYMHVSALNELTPPGEFSSSASAQDALTKLFQLDRSWDNGSAKGFSVLSYAVLTQPAVDLDRVPAPAVSALLGSAAGLRAFSYIRSVVLPLLRTCRDEHVAFYMSAVAELVGNVLTVLCLDVYPKFPFPISRVTQQEDSRWSSSQLMPGAGNGSAIGDSLEDLVELLDALCVAHPAFAERYLWRGANHHPFLWKAAEQLKDPALFIRLMAVAASGPDGSTAFGTYQFIEKKLAGKRDWHFLFCYMEDIAGQLGGLADAAAVRDPTPATSSASAAGDSSAKPRRVSPRDAEALLAICRLLRAVLPHSVALQSLQASFRRPDSLALRLFSLLACPVPCSVKGAIFKVTESIHRGLGWSGYCIRMNGLLLSENEPSVLFTF